MHAIEDADLLRRYADEKSEGAFAELVRRHLDFVYSVALRQAGGDAHLAEEVAQTVFTSLARKAAALANRPVLGGWLYRATQFAAIDAVRAESRRRARETEANTMRELTTDPDAAIDWDKLRPVLDRTMGELGEDDRDAVWLRFFEGKSFAEVGARLRLTENAARMRVERALDKLHGLLARRGVTSTTTALAVALGGQTGVAAPAGLAASVASAALAGGCGSGIGTGTAAGLWHFVSTTKFIIASTAVIAAVAIGMATNLAWSARATRAELANIEAQHDQLHAKLQSLNGNLAAAEQRAQAADADVDKLLAAVHDVDASARLPEGGGPRIAFVIDTSGSMRNPQADGLWNGVFNTIAQTLAARPDLKFVQLVDADGRWMLDSRDIWKATGADTLAEIKQVLTNYREDTVSNPVPGVMRALRGLPAADDAGARLEICVIGDEVSARDDADSVMRQLDRLNPADTAGKRRASISVVQLPTTIRYPGGEPANTGLRFQALMTAVARQHGGTYKLLSDDAMR